jgi:hypothetical protein
MRRSFVGLNRTMQIARERHSLALYNVALRAAAH